MPEKPTVDGRRRTEIRAAARARAPYYVPQWDPDAGGVGSALVDLFAEMAEDVVERLDQVPDKQFVSFLDTLGFDRAPPQPSRLPLSFSVVDSVEENVAIPAGTRALAPPAGTAPEQPFEVVDDGGFEATPAALTRVYSADPQTDELREHLLPLAEGRQTTLFSGTPETDLQDHALYIAHSDLFTLSEEATIWVEFETETPESVFTDDLTWQYFGTATPDDEEPAWHDLELWNKTVRGVPIMILLPAEMVGYIAMAVREQPELFEGELQVFPLLSTMAMGADDAVETDGGFGGTFGPEGFGGSLEAEVFSHEHAEARLAQGFSALPWTTAALASRAVSVVETAGGDIGDAAQIPDDTSRVLVGLTLPAEAEIGETTFAGAESRWIRCRIPREADPHDLFDVEIRDVTLYAGVPPSTDGGDTSGTIGPDQLLKNDVPLPATAESGSVIRPLGRVPRLLDTFYVASEEAFTKAGVVVSLLFEGLADAEDSAADLSWEYFDGGGWRRIPGVSGAATTLDGSGAGESLVSFAVPDDLAATTVAGHDGYWVRSRLVGGGYGDLSYRQIEESTTNADGTTTETERWETVADDIAAPSFTGVSLRYDQVAGASPDHLRSYNNHAFSPDRLDRESPSFAPFVGLREVTPAQTLFLGFDKPLVGGPLQVLLSLPDVEYARDFHPRIRWESSATPGEWQRVAATDGTESLTRTGILGVTVPKATTSVSMFGDDLHWLRGRVTLTPFGSETPSMSALTEASGDRGATAGTNSDGGGPTAGTHHGQSAHDSEAVYRGPCGTRLPTEPPAGTPGSTPPMPLGFYPNTGWAANVRTVTDEMLGSSDGVQHQLFTVSAPPAMDATVAVNERTSLSSEAQDALTDARPDAVEAVLDDDGTLTAFWVTWTAVDDFLDSGPEDRHYVVDATSGTMRFGDGTEGRIPPIGRENVRVSYRTGGGVAGNVDVDTVTELVSALPFVEAVTNPLAADGGADEETTEAVLVRGPQQLRDRGRAVAAPDFERLAMAASRKVARTRCVPGMDDAGGRTNGWVTVLIVPNVTQETPVPSVELTQIVHEALCERAPLSLVGNDGERLVVRGPSYVDASVECVVAAGAVDSLSALEAAVGSTIDAYLHPLTGDGGDGWEFGALPCISDLYALVESVDGVDHVDELEVILEGGGETVRIREGTGPPSVAGDVLVASGRHDVTASGGL